MLTWSLGLPWTIENLTVAWSGITRPESEQSLSLSQLDSSEDGKLTSTWWGALQCMRCRGTDLFFLLITGVQPSSLPINHVNLFHIDLSGSSLWAVLGLLTEKPPAGDLAVHIASGSFRALSCNYKLSERGNPAALRLAKSPSNTTTPILLSAIWFFNLHSNQPKLSRFQKAQLTPYKSRYAFTSKLCPQLDFSLSLA